jgi:subtilisin family serine protease
MGLFRDFGAENSRNDFFLRGGDMKFTRWDSRPAVVVLLLFWAIVIFPESAFPAPASAKNLDHFSPIWQKISTAGDVRVIVRLDVPMIQELTAASTRFAGISPGQTASLAMVNADAALRTAIDNTEVRLVAELQGTEFTVKRCYQSIPFLALEITPKALSVLQDSPTVLDIEEDVPLKLVDPVESGKGSRDAKSSAAADSWDFPLLADTIPLIGAKKAWANGYSGKNWYVAVLDTGIRKTHQFFTGKTIAEACFSSGYGTSGDCPNGQPTMGGSGAAAHFPSSYSGYDHGTHVSGIATGNYGSLAGVAKDANVFAVQVFSKFPASQCGGSSACVMSWNSDCQAGLDYIYSIRGNYSIASINMSLGAGGYSSACNSDSRGTVIFNLRQAGIATAIATGNDGYCGYVSAPACITASVAVGSSTKADKESSFNNWSASLQTLFAPGSSINSSTGGSDSSYAFWSGTSMATPHVAGAWAVLKSMISAGGVTTFVGALQSTGAPITSVCDNYRQPIARIQIDRAIAALSNYSLAVQSSVFGTTDPVPDTYYFVSGASFQVTAVPNTYAVFVNWSGGASGSANPLSVAMTASKSVMANFRYIYAPTVTGRKQLNRTFSQAEYIDILSWQAHPSNAGLDIVKYRIYQVSGLTRTLVAEVTADQTGYSRRNAGATALQYQIAAVTAGGVEGEPAAITIQ